MKRVRRLRLWVLVALVVAVVVAVISLVLLGIWPGILSFVSPGSYSGLPGTTSPLPTPAPVPGEPPEATWSGFGVTLMMWVILGGLLALGIILLVLRWRHQGEA